MVGVDVVRGVCWVLNLAHRDLVDGVLNGFNGTLLAYGQTGAGKSFTMVCAVLCCAVRVWCA